MLATFAPAAATRPAFDGVRLLLTVGAPVGAPLLDRAQAALRHASLRTPYGMTECLLIADITREAIHEAGPGNGVCVGPPTARASVRIAPLRRGRRARRGDDDRARA